MILVMDYIPKLKNIKILICDIDGVMTDGSIWQNTKGEWIRRFNVRDGVGIKILQKHGIEVAVISGGKSNDVETRLKFLGVEHVYLGAENKEGAFQDLLNKTKVNETECAYIGDDIYDLPLLDKVAFACTVPNAVESVLNEGFYITKREGGHGAVREVCDLILQHSQYTKESI